MSDLHPPPIIPTGYGYSFLDTVLHLRSRDGVVANTVSRLFIVAKVLGGAGKGGAGAGGAVVGVGAGASASSPGSPALVTAAAAPAAAWSASVYADAAAELSDVHSLFFERNPSTAAEVTGLAVAQNGSFWTVVEGPPEAVVGLGAALQAAAERPGSRLGHPRVAASVEDCPVRAWGPLAVRSISLAADSQAAAALAAEFEDAHPATAVVPTYRAIVDLGFDILDTVDRGEARNALLDSLASRFAASLPSDERVQALATASKVSPPYPLTLTQPKAMSRSEKRERTQLNPSPPPHPTASSALRMARDRRRPSRSILGLIQYTNRPRPRPARV